jgi:hypothetical protein
METRKGEDDDKLQDVENKEGVEQILYVSFIAVIDRELLCVLLGLDIESKASEGLEDGRSSLFKLPKIFLSGSHTLRQRTNTYSFVCPKRCRDILGSNDFWHKYDKQN